MPTTSSHYHQLQPEDRVTIASLKQQNHSVRAIARQLQRSPATISRELQRNACPSGYGSAQAQCLSLQRRRIGRPAIKLHPDSILWALVVHLLRLRWSPEQIALTLARLYPLGQPAHRLQQTTGAPILLWCPRLTLPSKAASAARPPTPPGSALPVRSPRTALRARRQCQTAG